ncbi:MAG: sugar phosphate isomerase/epimerase [Gemmataceae bacterium]|nr:sugar phosphate isomerase/epimerase [Gemmataceae bacterium]
MLNRREFAATALTGAILAPGVASAIEPIRRLGAQGAPHLKLSLAAYSFRKYLDLKAKPKPEMTMEGFAEYCAQQGLGAVEPTSYYFSQTSVEYMASFKLHCSKLGLDISGTAVGNNFCVPEADKLKEQLASVKEWIVKASILGCKTIRVFAGTVAKGDTEEKARERCLHTMGQACEHAAKYGVFLALENHGGITATADQLLALVKGLDHPNYGVNLDTGNFRTADPYGDMAKVAPYAVTVQVKTEVQKAGQKKEDADIERIVGILNKSGYRGYVALEYEAAEDPKTGVPKALSQMKKLLA